jgi:DNA-binding CsgD family transcriptional regulator
VFLEFAMARSSKSRGDLKALMNVAKTARSTATNDEIEASRKDIADFCKYLGGRFEGGVPVAKATPFPEGLKLSPRMRQTLDRLLAGDSEKQIAIKLAVSPHTVHVYVKALYRGFDVNSRGELLARFVQMPDSPK